MGIIEKITLDDVTMGALEMRAQESGRSVNDEVVAMLRAGLLASDARMALIERARTLRASLPPQTTDSLQLLREDRDR